MPSALRTVLRVVAIYAVVTGSVLDAHPLSVSYLHVRVAADRIAATMRLPLDDMDLLLRLDRDLDSRVSDQEITAGTPALAKYLAERMVLRTDSDARVAVLDRTGRWADSGGFPFLEAVVSYPVPALPTTLSLQVRVLTDLYTDHRTLGDVEWGGRRDEFVFQHGNLFEATATPAAWWQSARTFLQLGIEHILTGYDHLLFLVGLLVVGRGWRHLVVIVTSFTVAHSLTLVVATLGWVIPPSRLIEALIALTIAYVGIENLIARDVTGRWKLTFAFGLIHGFGFASVLREMALPRATLVPSLLMFNVGVEAGQLFVVLMVWPLLHWIQRSPYSLWFMRALSVAITLCGLAWLAQRVM